MKSYNALLIPILLITLYISFTQAASCPNNCSGNGQCVGVRCICFSGFGGEDCSFTDKTFANASSDSGTVFSSNWAFYHIRVSQGSSLLWVINQTGSGDCDLYIYKNDFPTRSRWTVRDVSTNKNSQISQDNVEGAIWVAGVYGFVTCSYRIQVFSYNPCPNNCSSNGFCSLGTCICNTGFSGPDCSLSAAIELPINSNYTRGSVQAGKWVYFHTAVSNPNTLLTYNMRDANGDCDMYLAAGIYPNLTYYVASNDSINSLSTIIYSAINASDYYLGIFGFWGCSFNLTLSSSANGTSDCSTTTKCSLHGNCSSSPQAQCICNTGYSGMNCETMNNYLSLSVPVHGYVFNNEWNYYHVGVNSSNKLIVQVNQTTSSMNGSAPDCDLYIKAGSLPTFSSYDFVKSNGEKIFNITIPYPSSAIWYIGVYGWTTCEYDVITYISAVCPNNCSNNGYCNANGICNCNEGWSGNDCSRTSMDLVDGVTVYSNTSFNVWNYFWIDVVNAYEVDIHLVERGNFTENGTLWLYASSIGYPTLYYYDFSDTTADDKLHSLKVTFTSPPVTRRIFIGVYGSPILHDSITVPFALVAWYPQF